MSPIVAAALIAAEAIVPGSAAVLVLSSAGLPLERIDPLLACRYRVQRPGESLVVAVAYTLACISAQVVLDIIEFIHKVLS